MPQFGIVTNIDHSPVVKAAGWDFVEELVQNILCAHVPDDEWQGPARLARAVLPMPAANAMLPAALKVCGPDADLAQLRDYMSIVLRRARELGMRTLVFGSGAARSVPPGFDRDVARQQIVDYARMSADLAGNARILLVFEPLNRGECNIINSVAEAMAYVRELRHPHFLCLVDSYHLWLENEPLDHVRSAMPWVRHVHLADTLGRAPSGETGGNDYVSFFRVLKEAGYDGPIAVESLGFSTVAGIESAGPRVLRFLKSSWESA